VRSVFSRFALVAALTSALAACGQPEEDERRLVSDRELAPLQQVLVPPEALPTQAAAGRTFYVRVAWGLLAGDRLARESVDWSGSLSVDEGRVQLTHLTASDELGGPEAASEESRIRWGSRTRSGFAGLVARVEVPSDDATVTLETPMFQRSFRASELTGGDEALFPLDAAGHAISISSLPASSCPGGFVLGYLRQAKLGWLAFGGRVTDRTGHLSGTLRFKALEDNSLKGQLLDDDGREIAQVRGALVREGGSGGSFSAELIDPSTGRAVGTFTGLYGSASAGSRGAFQGTFERICSE
jgi:hypothetical protein